jgi:hypothetical protein
MSLLGALGNAAKGVAGNAVLPGFGAIIGSRVDPTPGFSATNVAKTQVGKVFNSAGSNTGNKGGGAGGSNAGTGTTTTYSGSAYGSSGGSGGVSAAQQAANNQATSLANYNLGLLPQQLNAALGNVQNTYNQKNNELQSGYNSAENSFNQNTTSNKQSFVTNKNTIRGQASTGLQGLLRLLGQRGAGGSSAVGASQDAVGKQATIQMSGAGQTYGQNQQALDTNWGNYRNGFDNSKRQLADWLGQQQNSARSENEASKQSILRQLAGLQSNAAAAQPYIDQIKASAQRVASLAAFNPSYTGITPVYNAPELSAYTVGQAETPTFGEQGNNTGAGSTIAYLMGLGRDRQQNPINF